MTPRLDAGSLADALIMQCRATDYAGYDPFDGLNSVLFEKLGLGSLPFAKIAWLQLHKRSPVNLRPLAGIARRRNPKGIALIILGLLERERRTGDGWEIPEAARLAEWLLGQRCDRSEWRHNAWGYHFDWAARAFFVPRGTPNAITTCYIARGLAALGDRTGNQRFIDAATDAGLFVDSLYRKGDGYYAYIPGELAFVHNANLWAAAVVGETASRVGDNTLMHRALSAARLSVAMQREDGAWRYGTRDHHSFVDGFHTGYNLEALSALQRAAGTDEFDNAIRAGMDYYRWNFFLPDGTVKYYDNAVWPLDTHSVAQALLTLLKVGASNEDHRLATKVFERAVETLYMPRERRFMYQRGRLTKNRINYLRWTQAWAFYAIETYANRVRVESGKETIEYSQGCAQ
ncbi:aspartate-semialdehyde dehydrogenase [Paraburkholderia xenovorans]